MAGNKAGGVKAAMINKKKYGKDFYKKIGRMGGAKGTTGGFYCNRELARVAGSIGGSRTRMRKMGLDNPEQIKYRTKVQKAYEHLRKIQQKAAKERALFLRLES